MSFKGLDKPLEFVACCATFEMKSHNEKLFIIVIIIYLPLYLHIHVDKKFTALKFWQGDLKKPPGYGRG